MSRFFALPALMISALLAACGPAVPATAGLPTFISPAQIATPQANQAYPTAQAAQSNTSQTVSGFSFNMQRAWRDGKQVHADMCFTMPDASDWKVWAADFLYGKETISEFSSSLVSTQPASGAQPAQRCDELAFYVPPDADLSAAQLTIESIGAYPNGDEYCSLYMPKIQQALKDRGIQIELNCAPVNGSATMQIASKPADMSQEDAEKLVYSDEFYTVKGPWTFPVTFSQ
jgi:hypothetical protein